MYVCLALDGRLCVEVVTIVLTTAQWQRGLCALERPG